MKSILLLFIFSSYVFAQTPDWVKNQGKSARYPELAYLTGFGLAGLAEDDLEECMELAANHARSNLIQKIRVTIQSTIISQVEERDTKLSEYFNTATQVRSKLEVQGMEMQTFFHKKEKRCYAFVYVSREKLANIYGEKANGLRKEITGHLATGKRYEEAGQRTKALEAYLACYPLFPQLEEAQAVLTASRTNTTKAFAELDEKVTKDEVSITQVREAVQRLVQRPMNSPEDLAWYLTYCLKGQMGEQRKSVLVTPFTYQDTKMGSPFSRFFKQVLENKVVEVAKWQVGQQASMVQPKTRDISRAFDEASGAAYVLTGTYWEQPQRVKFLTAIRRVSDSKIMASAEALVDNSVLHSTNLSLKPQNFAQAFSDQKAFTKDEVIGGGLNLEVWTNKGIENLLYTEGDRLRIFVRVNMPCYLRFIYHLADSNRTLLLNNYYVDESKVNRVYQIPQEFECAPPFGAEVLQIFARTQKFEPVKTVEVDGYDILKEDLQRFLAKIRGFKKIKKDVLQSENRVVITTMAR